MTEHAKSTDKVNHPAHYNQGRFEVIDIIEDWDLDFNLGCVLKYIGRANHKGERIADLKKAQWYLNRAVSKAISDDFKAQRTKENNG